MCPQPEREACIYSPSLLMTLRMVPFPHTPGSEESQTQSLLSGRSRGRLPLWANLGPLCPSQPTR